MEGTTEMKTATKVRQVTLNDEQDAAVYQLELDPADPTPQHEFVFVSAVNHEFAHETMVFACDNDWGANIDWTDLACVHNTSHADALAVLGFEIA